MGWGMQESLGESGFAEISNYSNQPTIMRWFDATLAVINSDETGPLISMSDAGDYEKGRCRGRAKDLFMNKWMAPPSPSLLLRPLNVLSAQPPPTTLLLILLLLPHRPDSGTQTPQQCCIEMIFALSSHYKSNFPFAQQWNGCSTSPHVRKWRTYCRSALWMLKLPCVFLQLKISCMLKLQQQQCKSIEQTELLDWLCYWY